MIYPVLRYHDGSFRCVNAAKGMGYDRALAWINEEAAAELPPLLQYRSFVNPETGRYGALLTTADPFPDRDGRYTPTKIMLIFDSDAVLDLMQDPGQIPALAAYMRTHLADPFRVHQMTELPDLSHWMEEQAAAEQSEESELIRCAVRSGKVCCVTDNWETLLAALQKMKLGPRCRTAFSVGWRTKENADLFDVIVTNGEEGALVRPTVKRIWTKERHELVQEDPLQQCRMEFRTDDGKGKNRIKPIISDNPKRPKRPKRFERTERPEQPRRPIRVGRILCVLAMVALLGFWLFVNVSGAYQLGDLGRVYIQLSIDGNELINGVLMVGSMALSYLLGKLRREGEVDEE